MKQPCVTFVKNHSELPPADLRRGCIAHLALTHRTYRRVLTGRLQCLIVANEPSRSSQPLKPGAGSNATVTDDGLEHIITLQQLERADISGCVEVSGAGVRLIISCLPQLKQLLLKHCPKLTDGSLAVLASVPAIQRRLEYFVLSGSWEISESGLAHVTHLHGLQKLHLTCSGLTDSALSAITHSNPELRQLELGGCWSVTDNGLASLLAPLSHLQRLKLVRCTKISDVGLAAIATTFARRALLQLDLSGCAEITDDGLGHLAAALPSLTHLLLNWCPAITDRGMGHIAVLSRLEQLKLGGGGSSITDAGLALIACLSQLRHLSILCCTGITDRSLACLTSLRLLRHLELGACHGVTNDGVACLDVFPRLQHLTLMYCPCITNIGLSRLARLPHLERLVLRGCENVTTAPPITGATPHITVVNTAC
jgi:F-box and leucine-rich repeat protein 14